MNNLEKLKSAKNRKELAKLLGYAPKSLTAIIYKTPPSQKYSSFEISKKSGGLRKIKAPNKRLKKLQQHLANLLYSCQAEIETERNASPVSFGFRRGTSIIEHAKKHKRKRHVLNLDIEDFFPSLNFGRVRGYFLKDNNFKLEEEVATTIAQIACDEIGLPQGSPCSPIISELICQIIDLRLLRFAKKHGLTYSRYADDITFSTNQKVFPKSVATYNVDNGCEWKLGKELVKRIETSGFKINDVKTRMQTRGSRQEVTGLVVNEKVNIRSRYYRNARAMCDSLFSTGLYYTDASILNDDGSSPETTDSLYPLQGILNHIYHITQSEERRPVHDQRVNPRAIRTLFRRFLFFKNCVALTKPLIITEGKTDPVYLREAMRSLHKDFPNLCEKTSDGFKFHVSFFNYNGKVHEVSDLSGGAGDLKSIPLDYLRNLPNQTTQKQGKHHGRKPILYKPMLYPVILLLDNDDGLSAVAGTIKKNFDIKIGKKDTSAFYHITENLYLIKTLEINGDSCIEDMFPEKWLKKKLKGKSFSTKAKIDPHTEYSKEIFANSIIRPNAADIDFSGFKPLLERISVTLNQYSKNKI